MRRRFTVALLLLREICFAGQAREELSNQLKMHFTREAVFATQLCSISMVHLNFKETTNDKKARGVSAHVGDHLLPGNGKEGEMESPLRWQINRRLARVPTRQLSRQGVESRRRDTQND